LKYLLTYPAYFCISLEFFYNSFHISKCQVEALGNSGGKGIVRVVVDFEDNALLLFQA
jgi:hypothetical protein